MNSKKLDKRTSNKAHNSENHSNCVCPPESSASKALTSSDGSIKSGQRTNLPGHPPGCFCHPDPSKAQTVSDGISKTGKIQQVPQKMEETGVGLKETVKAPPPHGPLPLKTPREKSFLLS